MEHVKTFILKMKRLGAAKEKKKTQLCKHSKTFDSQVLWWAFLTAAKTFF